MSNVQGTVSSSGVGSGIDIQSLVTKLVAAEGQPKQAALATQSARATAQLSAYGSFRSAASQLQATIDTLKDAKSFKNRSATVGDPTLLSVSAASNAAPGTYNLEVQQLASGSKLVSGPLAAASTVVGTGTLTLAAGSSTFTVTIDGSNNTLAGIRDAINAASGSSGVAASLVTANDGVRLVLNSAATGAANGLTVTQSGGDGGLAQLSYDPARGITNLTQLQAAQDARIKVDGFTYGGPSNSITAAIDGLTLNLKAASALNVTTPLTVAVDQNASQVAITAFVKAYNDTLASLGKLGAYDASSKQGGVLLGDATLLSFLSGLRSKLGSQVTGLGSSAVTTLAQIGITTSLDGSLAVDSSKLSTVVAANADAVSQLFTSTTGIATTLSGFLKSFTQSDGVLDSRTKGLQKTLNDIGNRQSQLQLYLDSYQARITQQFNAMDRMVANLKSTGDSLLSQLNSIDYNYFGSTKK